MSLELSFDNIITREMDKIKARREAREAQQEPPEPTPVTPPEEVVDQEAAARQSRLHRVFADVCMSDFKQAGTMSYIKLLNSGPRVEALEGPHRFSPELQELALQVPTHHNDRHKLIYPFSMYTKIPDKGRMWTIRGQETVPLDQIYMWWREWKGTPRPQAMYGPNVVVPGLEEYAAVHQWKDMNVSHKAIFSTFDELVDYDQLADQGQILQLRYIYPGGKEFAIVRWPESWGPSRFSFMGQNYVQYDGLLYHEGLSQADFYGNEQALIVILTEFDPRPLEAVL